MKPKGKVRSRRGTRITFWPDKEIFGEKITFKPATLYRIARAKAYLFRGVEIRWKCDSRLLSGVANIPENETLRFPNGLIDYLDFLLQDSELINDKPFSGDISLQKNELESARDLYYKSIEYSDDPGPIMRKLLFVYIDMGDNQKAIDYSNELLDKYPNDANLYYNIGVLYQRLAKDIQIRSKENFNRLNEMDSPPEDLISQVYSDFREVRKYANNAKDYFYEASDLEKDENLDTKHAISEMKSAMDQMDDIFIPSIRKIAKSAGVELN